MMAYVVSKGNEHRLIRKAVTRNNPPPYMRQAIGKDESSYGPIADTQGRGTQPYTSGASVDVQDVLQQRLIGHLVPRRDFSHYLFGLCPVRFKVKRRTLL